MKTTLALLFAGAFLISVPARAVFAAEAPAGEKAGKDDKKKSADKDKADPKADPKKKEDKGW